MKAIVQVEEGSVTSRQSKASGNSYRLQLVRFRPNSAERFRDVELFVPRDCSPLPVGVHAVEFPITWRSGKLEVGFPEIVAASAAVREVKG